MTRLAGSGAPRTLLSLPLRDAVTGAGFSVGVKDLYSGSHHYKANTALAEPSPQPLVSFSSTNSVA